MREERDKLYRDEALAYKLLGPQSAPIIAQGSYFKLQLWLWAVLLLVALYVLMKTHKIISGPGQANTGFNTG